MNDVIRSKRFKIAAGIVGGIILAVLIFSAGVGVGTRKARFAYKFGENYERNFGGPRQGPMMGFMKDFDNRDFRNPHGISGTIISISNNSLAVKDKDNKELTINIDDKTSIISRGDNISTEKLKSGDSVVVIGEPGENGAITARFIRVFANNDNNIQTN